MSGQTAFSNSVSLAALCRGEKSENTELEEIEETELNGVEEGEDTEFTAKKTWQRQAGV